MQVDTQDVVYKLLAEISRLTLEVAKRDVLIDYLNAPTVEVATEPVDSQ